MATKKPVTIALPKSWAKYVRTAMLHVVSLAQYATAESFRGQQAFSSRREFQREFSKKDR